MRYHITELQNLIDDVSDHNKPSHTAIYHHLKPLCLTLQHNHQFIQNLVPAQSVISDEYKNMIRQYFQFADDKL